ncbi:MAG: two-component sensor histidine kinase [Psychrobium sp.]|nr:two-component sensor histidine kinase [Psychrobium sp.]
MRALTISLFCVVLLATIGLGWMFDKLASQYSAQNSLQQKDAITVLEQLGSNLAMSLDSLAKSPFQRQLFIDSWQENGQYRLHIVAMDNFQLPKKLIDEVKIGKPLLLETDDSIALYFYMPSSDELIVLTAPPVDVKQNGGVRNFLLTSLFYIAMLLVFFLWLYPLARRLLALRRVAKAFGEGQLEQRVAVGSISYISDLEQEFNHMAQRIEDLVNDVKLLSGAVSHDLRTPLARIQFGIDTLQEEDDPVLRRRFEQRISDNVTEMVDLVETLLNYARLDQAMLQLDKRPVNLSALVVSCLNNKETESIKVKFIGENSKANVHADPAYLMILINNLVQNAMQYCQDEIAVEIIERNNAVQLVVSDNGLGIDVNQRDKMLKPFTRGDNVRSQVKGYGMGLAIVKRIVEWHKGEIEIEKDAVLLGARFVITLPK